MDVVCFSFDCTFNVDGSSNCSTTDPKYLKTTKSTTSTPTTQPTPLPTRQTSHPVVTSQKPSVVTSQKPSVVTSQKPSVVITSVPKPSPGKPSSTPLSTGRPPSSHTSSPKPTVATTVIITTTANNSRLPDPPLPHKGTSHLPGDSAGGKSIYIPCLVVGCVVVFLFVSIGVIRRHRNRRRSSEDTQPLLSEAERDLILEDASFQFNVQTRYVQPITGHDDQRFSIDDSSVTEDNDSERLGLQGSNDSDDLKTSPRVDVDEVKFNASTVRQKQRKHGGNNSGLV
ncbi:endochitinase A-like [Mizuhopecten yessoensis]|uniref:endochitinase A-like n=1 Tax=Mizuhopecten yessoensis TaxID=6573 RepID=UPI000B45D7BB|nr:endochitinase A-like [Mizuhopecten yessoensis]